MRNKKSKVLIKQSQRYIPGGVNSPVRAFKSVGGSPLFIERGKGAHIYDVDGNAYIDYVMSWGALILGHSYPGVLKKIKEAMLKGTSFGAPTKKEVEFAKIICRAIPSIEKLRMVNSGTEATMNAIRLARGYTRHDKIIKFEGCYHGSVDSLLVKAGSGQATLGISTSSGVTGSLARDTLVCPYNDIDYFYNTVKAWYKKIACCIVEPICGNMGVVAPKNGFLYKLKEITERYNILLIFDEVITGFRFCFGGVQNIFKIKPDITCLGKIIGGGLSCGAYGGRSEIMNCIAPEGDVYQAGTLSGNPLVVTAGMATLETLSGMNYDELDGNTRKLCEHIEEILRRKNIDFCLNRFGSMFTLFFTNEHVDDFRTAKTSDTKKYARYFWKMIEGGAYIPPSQFEANFVSFMHSRKDIENTVSSCAHFLTSIK